MEKSKITITVTTHGGEYFATRTLDSNMPDFNPTGKVFSMTEEIDPSKLQAFHQRVKEECRKRGIAKVVNLD